MFSKKQPEADVEIEEGTLTDQTMGRCLTQKAVENPSSSKVPWIPTVIQGVTLDPLDGVSYLVMMVEMPSHVDNKGLLNVKVTDDGRFLEVHRPRGQIVSDMGFAEKAMVHDGGKHIDPANIRSFVGVLNTALWEVRGRKNGGVIYDLAKITLLEAVQPSKKPIVKLIEAYDRTCGLLVILQTKSREKVMSDDESDDGKLVFSPAANKKRNSASLHVV
jgi:hypothetical protein